MNWIQWSSSTSYSDKFIWFHVIHINFLKYNFSQSLLGSVNQFCLNLMRMKFDCSHAQPPINFLRMNPTTIPNNIWVVLEQGNGTPTLLSTLGCECVDQFKKAIKKEFAPDLDSCSSSRIRLFQADGLTEIATDDTISELKEKLEYKDNGKQKALVLRVDQSGETRVRSTGYWI